MIDTLKTLIKQFMPFAQERMGFDKPPRLFLKNDSKNAKNPLGKTAFYDPNNSSVTIYTTNRHPKDVMRSLSHELVHHTQNCRGDFDNVGEMGEGYAQNDEHLREMEREAYELGNMCFRDWEDSIKSTIYFERLQKGVKSSMSTKDWKNKELTTILSEAWGFKFNTLEEFNEFNGSGEIQEEQEEIEEELKNPDKADLDDDGKLSSYEKKRGKAIEKSMAGDDDKKDSDDKDDEAKNESVDVFAPNHYCVHHGGVHREGKIEMAEAVSHNYNTELDKVTHYDMKFADGTIMEGVPFEDIQVTNASLAQEHKHTAKRDVDDDDDLEEGAASSGRQSPHADRRGDDERKRPMEENEVSLPISEARLKEIISHVLKTKG